MVLFFRPETAAREREAARKHLEELAPGASVYAGELGGAHFLLVPGIDDDQQQRLSSIPGVASAFPIEDLPLAERLLMLNAGAEPGIGSGGIAFQGVRGAYSEIAVRQTFGDTADPVPCPQFRDVFEAVRDGRCAAGVLPLENALAGPILDTYDLILQHPEVSMCGETYVRVNHHLIGLPGASLADIKRVFSHPQGLAQSADYLAAHPGWEQVPFFDTAGSVLHVRELGDPANAAIASGIAATVYGMQVLHQGTETNPKNFTRFGVFMRSDSPRIPRFAGKSGLKASLLFSLPHRPGSLLDCLQVMADQGLNLTKIESRPIHGRPWEYLFHVDVDVTVGIDRFHMGCKLLEGMTEHLRVTGLYPRAEAPA